MIRDLGRLNQRAAFDEPVAVSDGAGGSAVSWTERLKRWAAVAQATPAPGQEAIEGGAMRALASAVLTIREDSETQRISAKWRVRIKGRIWAVKSVTPSGRDGSLRLSIESDGQAEVAQAKPPVLAPFSALSQAEATARFTAAPFAFSRLSAAASVMTEAGRRDLIAANTPRIEHKRAGARLGYLSRRAVVARGGGAPLPISATVTDYNAAALGDAYALTKTVASNGARWHRYDRAYALEAGRPFALAFYFLAGTSARALLNIRRSDGQSLEVSGPAEALAQTAAGLGVAAGLAHSIDSANVHRVDFTFTPPSTAAYSIGIGPDSAVAGETIHILGWNVVEDLRNSYVREADNDVAVDGDRLSYELSALFDAGGYVVVDCELSLYAEPGAVVFESALDANNRIALARSGGDLIATLVAGGASTTLTAAGVWTGARRKIGLRWDASGARLNVDGPEVASTTDDRVAAHETLYLGVSRNGDRQLNGLLYDARFNEGAADLAALTAP